jgi:hypothetical protein
MADLLVDALAEETHALLRDVFERHGASVMMQYTAREIRLTITLPVFGTGRDPGDETEEAGYGSGV